MTEKSRNIATNKKAFHDYDILEKVEAGIELTGSEVKSVRAGRINLSDAYAFCHHGEIILQHLHITPWDHGNAYAPDPYRKRRLLLHKKEIVGLASAVARRKLTLIPLRVYFRNQWVKLELGLCRGRKKHDKRRAIAEKEQKRRLDTLMKTRR